jgi:hypothetical protein
MGAPRRIVAARMLMMALLLALLPARGGAHPSRAECGGCARARADAQRSVRACAAACVRSG